MSFLKILSMYKTLFRKRVPTVICILRRIENFILDMYRDN